MAVRQLFGVVAAALVGPAAAGNADFPAPEFTLDLGASAYERWAPVVEALLDAHGYEYTWKPLHDFMLDVVPYSDWVLTAPLWDLVLASFPAEQREEVKAMHQLLQSKGYNWTVGQLTMAQLFYEVEEGCTSIVAQNTNGSIFHARNLDYGLPGLQNFTATLTFLQDGHPVYRGTTYVGYFGLLTGQRLQPDGRATWSVSLNEREEKNPWLRTVAALLTGAQNVGFILRRALQTHADFPAAMVGLRTEHFSAPAYVTLAGVVAGDGAVITRDRLGVAEAPQGRGVLELNASDGEWYRMQFNSDNWEPFPSWDHRLEVGQAAMEALGQEHVDNDGLRNVLEQSPVLNSETTYTSLIFNDIGYFQTIVRMEQPELSVIRREAMRKKVSMELHGLFEWYLEQQFRSSDVESVAIV